MKIVTDEATKELVRLRLLAKIEAQEEALRKFDEETDSGLFPKVSDGEFEARNRILRELLGLYELRDKFFFEDETGKTLAEERKKSRLT